VRASVVVGELDVGEVDEHEGVRGGVGDGEEVFGAG
jgi:hypothetical protein